MKIKLWFDRRTAPTYRSKSDGYVLLMFVILSVVLMYTSILSYSYYKAQTVEVAQDIVNKQRASREALRCVSLVGRFINRYPSAEDAWLVNYINNYYGRLVNVGTNIGQGECRVVGFSVGSNAGFGAGISAGVTGMGSGVARNYAAIIEGNYHLYSTTTVKYQAVWASDENQINLKYLKRI